MFFFFLLLEETMIFKLKKVFGTSCKNILVIVLVLYLFFLFCLCDSRTQCKKVKH